MKKYRLKFFLSDGTQITAGEFEIPEGKIPVKGVDYFTEADKAELVEDVLANSNLDALQNKVTDLEKSVSDLNYKAIAINSFGASPSNAEMGSTVNSVTLSWTVNKTPTALTLDGADVAPDVRQKTVTGTFTANKTWTLKATDEREATATKTTTLSFLNGIYYGVSNITTVANSNGVLTTFRDALTKSLRSSKLTSFDVNAGAGQYIYYCLPKRMGTCAFNVGGFDGGFSLVATANLTNASGYTEEYYIYRSDNASLGQTAVKVS